MDRQRDRYGGWEERGDKGLRKLGISLLVLGIVLFGPTCIHSCQSLSDSYETKIYYESSQRVSEPADKR